MNPFPAKPGETISGVGLDFATRLAVGETLLSVVVTPVAGVTVNASGVSGTIAAADISIAANQADADLALLYAVTGTAGSIRKGYRTIQVRAVSN